eukprot:2095731-Amphidinium_carterae.1
MRLWAEDHTLRLQGYRPGAFCFNPVRMTASAQSCTVGSCRRSKFSRPSCPRAFWHQYLDYVAPASSSI